MSARYVNTRGEVRAAARSIRSGATQSMLSHKPTIMECALWAAIELLAECVEVLAEGGEQ